MPFLNFCSCCSILGAVATGNKHYKPILLYLICCFWICIYCGISRSLLSFNKKIELNEANNKYFITTFIKIILPNIQKGRKRLRSFFYTHTTVMVFLILIFLYLIVLARLKLCYQNCTVLLQVFRRYLISRYR